MKDYEYYEWAKDTLRKFQGFLHVQFSAETNMLPKKPSLVIDWDGEDSYTSKVDWVVHLGVRAIARIYQGYIQAADNAEERLLFVTLFTMRHEICHLKYTGGKSYSWGVVHSTEAVYEEFSKILEGTPRKFRRNGDVETYRRELCSKGIYIPEGAVERIMANIANSICDGRIERIESGKSKGFAKDRFICRSQFWENGAIPTVQKATFDELAVKPSLHLTVLLNQILTISKCQAYQKGFTMQYAGTAIIDEMNLIMPYIFEGYMGRTTKQVAEATCKIGKVIAPLVLEAVQSSAADSSEMSELEELLRQLLIMIANSNYGSVDGNAEEDEEQNMNSALPFSNLVITLPDDVYDKLEQNAKKTDDTQNGIQIRREHPKEEEKKDQDDETDSSSGSGSDSSDDQNNNSGENSSGESSSEGTSSEGSSGESGDQSSERNDDMSESSNQGAEGKSSDQSDENQTSSMAPSSESDGSAQESSDSSESQSSENQSKQSDSKASAKGKADIHADDGLEERLAEAMKKAVDEANAKMQLTINAVNQAAISAGSQRAQMTERHDDDAPVTADDVADVCEHFKEVKREYEVTDELPYELAQRGRVMRQANERRFKEKAGRAKKHRRSGNVDVRAIPRLAKNKLDVFETKSLPEKTDGAVYILIDNSGSMSGEKRRAACMAAAVVEEGFKGLMPMKIVAFDEWGEVVHEVVKGWNESLKKNCCYNFMLHGREGCGNEDSYDIAIATKELLNRPEKRKLMVVLSDGAPGNTKATRKAIEAARQNGIQVIGIYFEIGEIGSDADTFRYMYQTDYVCCTTEEIDTQLSTILEVFARK